MRRASPPYVCMLAILAVLHAQVFGLTQNYLVAMNGVVVETTAEHHHEGAALDNAHLANYVPHSHHSDAGDEEPGTEHHMPAKVDLKAPRGDAPVHAPVCASDFAMMIPMFFMVSDIVSSGSPLTASKVVHTEANLSQPECRLAPSCVVMLI